MPIRIPPFTYPDRLQRLVLLGVAGFDLAAITFGRYQAQWITFAAPAAGAAVMFAFGWFYRAIRPDARLSSALASTGYVIAFAALGAPLSYIAASANLPLQDQMFFAFDRALGLDWSAYLDFVFGHPSLRALMMAAYTSFFVQTITTVLVLGFSNHIRQLHLFICAFMMTTLVTIAMSALFPAEGPWLFLDMHSTANRALPLSATSWPVFHGLRDGTFNILTGLHSEGIITFPSLHAGLGVLFATALWPVRWLRWLALALNSMMILSTPIEGSHYFVDTIAGVAIAAAVWITLSRFFPAEAPSSARTISPSIVPNPPVASDETRFSQTPRRLENI